MPSAVGGRLAHLQLPQGTAITEEQLILLEALPNPKIECLLDGDAAGRKAALRTLPLCFKVGTEFSYLSLPEKRIPMTYFEKAEPRHSSLES